MEFKVGQLVRLKYQYKYEHPTLYGYNMIVDHCENEDLYLSTLEGVIAFRGRYFNHMFERTGNNINNEAYELITNHEIKSFQAILEDGRVINISCLN